MNALGRARRYRDWAEESVALAKAAISNEMRAQHYAIAQHFHLLAAAELKTVTSSPAGEFEVSAPRSDPSQLIDSNRASARVALSD